MDESRVHVIGTFTAYFQNIDILGELNKPVGLFREFLTGKSIVLEICPVQAES